MLNIVGALFAAESEAREAMAALSETPRINGTTIYQISLVKRNYGELKLCDNFTSEYLTSGDTKAGGIVGGLIGILGGPLGMLLGGAAGALIGKSVDNSHKMDSKSLIEQVAQRLEEGDVGLIILAEEENEAVLDHMLVKYNNFVVRYDPEVIAKEVEQVKKLEKEMAQQLHDALRAAEEE